MSDYNNNIMDEEEQQNNIASRNNIDIVAATQENPLQRGSIPPTPIQQTPLRSRNPLLTRSPLRSQPLSQQSDQHNSFIQSTPIQTRDRDFVAGSAAVSRPRGDLGRTTVTSQTYSALRATEYLPAGRTGNRMIVVSTPMDDTPKRGSYTGSVIRSEVAQRIQGLRAPLNLAGLLDEDNTNNNNNSNNNNNDRMQEEDEGELDIEGTPQPETRIWGTDINVQHCADVFRSFLHFFVPPAIVLTSETEVEAEVEAEPMTEMDEDTQHLSFYRKKLYHLVMRDAQTVLPLDLRHLLSFPATKQLHNQLLHFPQDIIPILDHIAHDEACQVCGHSDIVAQALSGRRIQVRPCHLPQTSRLRALNPQDIETLVAVQGLVVRVSSVVPDLKQAFFRCSLCHVSVTVVIDRGRIAEPSVCHACNASGSMSLVHNRCVFSDKQLVRLQERPDEVPEGETPTTVSVFAYDDLVDALRPGDRVVVTGILRAVPRRASSKMRAVQAVFRTFLDAIHFQRKGLELSFDQQQQNNKHNKQQEHEEDEDEDLLMNEDHIDDFDNTNNANDRGINVSKKYNKLLWAWQEAQVRGLFSSEKVAQFRRFAAREDVYEVLLRSFAPSVYGMEDVKQGLLCLLFGGTYHSLVPTMQQPDHMHKNFNNAESNAESNTNSKNNGGSTFQMHLRGDINILLCGDPGTSKSQLLSYVHQLSSRGIYTSGRGSSAVGLTASVVRDPETRDTVLESGALVLSDRGVCCIDEFDKMSVGARAVLHEALEQQSVSVTKAGIVATLHARAAVLASANPAQSRYNARLSVTDNLQLPPTLLSRFDLIFLILDRPDAEHDRRLARHLVSLYYDMEDGQMNADTSASAGSIDNNGSNNSNTNAGKTHINEEDEENNAKNNNQSQQEDVAICRSVSQLFLREFIQFARACLSPQLTVEAQQALVTHYLELRHHHHFNVPNSNNNNTINNATGMMGSSSGGLGSMKVISATPRQLESLIRLSQARAKMRLSNTVSLEDVSQSVRLMRVATQSAATDPRTGLIDMDLLTTGSSLSSKHAQEHLVQTLVLVLVSLTTNNGSSATTTRRVSVPQLRQEIQRHIMNNNNSSNNNGSSSVSVSGSEVEQAVRALEAEGVLQFVTKTGTVLVRSAAVLSYAHQHRLMVDTANNEGSINPYNNGYDNNSDNRNFD